MVRSFAVYMTHSHTVGIPLGAAVDGAGVGVNVVGAGVGPGVVGVEVDGMPDGIGVMDGDTEGAGVGR